MYNALAKNTLGTRAPESRPPRAGRVQTNRQAAVPPASPVYRTKRGLMPNSNSRALRAAEDNEEDSGRTASRTSRSSVNASLQEQTRQDKQDAHDNALTHPPAERGLVTERTVANSVRRDSPSTAASLCEPSAEQQVPDAPTAVPPQEAQVQEESAPADSPCAGSAALELSVEQQATAARAAVWYSKVKAAWGPNWHTGFEGVNNSDPEIVRRFANVAEGGHDHGVIEGELSHHKNQYTVELLNKVLWNEWFTFFCKTYENKVFNLGLANSTPEEWNAT